VDEAPARGHTVPGSHFAAALPAAGQDEWLAVELEDGADWNIAAELLARRDLVLASESVQAGEVSESAVQRMYEAMAAWSASRSAHLGADELRLAGLAAAPVIRAGELFLDAQLWARDGIVRMDHP